MRKKYKISLCALLLVGATGMMTARAQGSGKPTLAVFVVGMDNGTLDNTLATQIAAELNRNSRYNVLPSTNNELASKFTELRAAHTAGNSIDRNALAEWGRDNGISTICLVTDAIKGNDHMFYAHLIDAKDSKVSGRGSYIRTGVVSADLPRVSLALSRQLDGPGRRRSVNVTPQQKWFEPEMVFVEGGTFQMGYNASVDGTKSHGIMTAHSVTMNNFYIGKYEVTRAQWIAVMSGAKGRVGATTDYTQDISDPSYWKTDDQLPVERVSWEDITGKDEKTSTDIPEIEGYLERLNALTGKKYRLPTEEEWEYAVRGGKHQKLYMYSGSNDLRVVGWGTEEGRFTHVVGGKLPNALGIYDMSGNVWEWCSNCWRVDYNSAEDCTRHVVRGGSWYDATSLWVRAAARSTVTSSERPVYLGFRVAMD
jgi:formylglycine-generating enzyme required for sulfatase activity